MRDLSDFMQHPNKRLDADAVVQAYALQLTGEHLRGEELTDARLCQGIFDRLAAEPVVLSPALAKENQALLHPTTPTQVSPQVKIVANDSWFAHFIGWRNKTGLVASLTVLGLAFAGGVYINNNQSPAQLTAAQQAKAVALDEYLKAHKAHSQWQLQSQQPGLPSVNPHIQNASIRVTY